MLCILATCRSKILRGIGLACGIALHIQFRCSPQRWRRFECRCRLDNWSSSEYVPAPSISDRQSSHTWMGRINAPWKGVLSWPFHDLSYFQSILWLVNFNDENFGRKCVPVDADSKYQLVDLGSLFLISIAYLSKMGSSYPSTSMLTRARSSPRQLFRLSSSFIV